MLKFIVENWYLIFIIIAFIVVLSVRAYTYLMKRKQVEAETGETPPLISEEQLTKVKKWLLMACAVAERELGGGTGQLKLSLVYDKFLSKFGFLAEILTFEMFSDLVDDALIQFRKLLDTNKAVGDYVSGTSNTVPTISDEDVK